MCITYATINSPTQEMICGQMFAKIQISLPPRQQDNSTALQPGQSDRSNPYPMPHHAWSEDKLNKKFLDWPINMSHNFGAENLTECFS